MELAAAADNNNNRISIRITDTEIHDHNPFDINIINKMSKEQTKVVTISNKRKSFIAKKKRHRNTGFAFDFVCAHSFVVSVCVCVELGSSV